MKEENNYSSINTFSLAGSLARLAAWSSRQVNINLNSLIAGL